MSTHSLTKRNLFSQVDKLIYERLCAVMAKTEIVMPRFGAQNKEGQILKWYVSVGDHVEEDDALAEVKTEKTNADVESLYAGTITEIIGTVGTTYKVGEIIAYIEED